MSDNLIIRAADINDFEAIYLLQKEFALFQKTPEKLKITVAQMQKDKDLFHCLVAVVNDKIIGFVTYFPAYYSWTGKAFYVDDLYVQPAYRGQSAGKQLLEAIISIAKEKECKKVRWQVSGWNKNAIEFYQSLGATVDDTESNCDYILG